MDFLSARHFVLGAKIFYAKLLTNFWAPNLKSQTTTQLTLMIDTFSSSDNMMLNPKMSMEKQEAMKKMEVLSLIEAARSSGLPWDYYLSQMYKRSSTSESSMDDNFINLTDIGDLGIDDLLNQPRLLDRETRDDGRRYLMWRKITG